MKIISVVFFALALAGTWMLAHAQKSIPESVHEGIQNDLKRVITEYVQKNLPESKNLRFEKFWTETVTPKQVKAHFAYAYEDKTEDGEAAEVGIEGSATLNKTGETAENSTWSFDEIRVSDDQITFTEPMEITAGAGELEVPSGTATDSKKSNSRTNPTAPKAGVHSDDGTTSGARMRKDRE